MYLFIDSTYDLYLGILDESLEWLDFANYNGQKASAILQPKVHELLAKHNLLATSLKGLFIVNGPGFYTGLRLAEGFSDVLSFFGVKKYSFYSYEIPYWCGHEKGTWFTKAYRGEYFFFNWDGNAQSSKLIKASDLESISLSESVFIHSRSSLDAISEAVVQGPIHTIDLLRSKPGKIFSRALQQPSKEPFYFRAPEDEFKVNP
jgi:tRNA threonylcarbamoyladenosine biosynthesis protein TsaB